MENNYLLKHITSVAVTLIVTTVLVFFIRRILNYFINRSTSQLNVNPTNFVFLKNSISFVGYGFALLWIFYKIPYFKSLGTALFAGAGVLAAIIGFASQKAFANIIAGLFILFFKPFKIGDTIEILGIRRGVVEEITLRHTVIRDYENRRIVVPNGIISEQTIVNSNLIDEKVRKHIEITISYNSDFDSAVGIIKDVLLNHPLSIDNRTTEEKENNIEEVEVRMIRHADSGVVLKAYVWAANSDNGFLIQCAALEQIKKEFDKNSIEIPYPHRTVYTKQG